MYMNRICRFNKNYLDLVKIIQIHVNDYLNF